MKNEIPSSLFLTKPKGRETRIRRREIEEKKKQEREEREKKNKSEKEDREENGLKEKMMG